MNNSAHGYTEGSDIPKSHTESSPVSVDINHLKEYIEGRISEAYKCLESGMWEHWPFDDCTREQIEGMKRAYGDLLITINARCRPIQSQPT
jgi:hypothetical protein